MAYTTGGEFRALGVLGIIGVFIDGLVTMSAVAVVAESEVNLLVVFLTASLNVLGIPIGLGAGAMGIGLPRWVWIFITVGWVGQWIMLLVPLETLFSTAISFIVSGLIAFLGFIAGGWGAERVVDTFVAVWFPFSSGISMTGANPFNFTAPELGIVAVGWILIFIVSDTSESSD